MVNRLLSAFLLLLLGAACPDAFAKVYGPADDISGVINRYTEVVEVIPCLRTVRIADPSISLAAGDRVVMIQMKGARISEANDSTFGALLDLGGAGNVEYLVVERVSSDSVFFTTPWVHTYNVAGAVQLVRVAVYEDAHVISPVVPQPWNGRTGGVVALDVTKTLVLDAEIRASGMGFRAGRVSQVKDFCDARKWSSPFTSGEGGEKGEGIVTYARTDDYAAKGAAANGAGGGNGANAGGGGGANGGNGGNGGDASDKCTPYAGAGGRAGTGCAGYVPQQRLFMGGGGGGGHQNDLQGTSGTRGGGIVMIRTGNILTSAATIVSVGESVRDTSAWRNGKALEPGDGAGGGGAGGSVYLEATRIIGPVTVNVRGGDGGNVGARYQPAGPGGGGSGGVVVLTSSYPSLTVLAAGGKPGVHTSFETAANVYRRPWGATAGDSGVIISAFTWKTPSNPPLSVSGGGSICDGDSLTLTASEGFAGYRWSTGQTGRSIVTRSGGRYDVYATDSSGCIRPPVGADVVVRSTQVLIDRAINFGTTEVGIVLKSSCVIRNLGSERVSVSSIAVPTDVRLVSPLPPFDIAVADSMRIELEFLAPRVMVHSDSMQVNISAPCAASVASTTNATVTGERVMFLLPEVAIAGPGFPGVVPIRLRMDSPTPPIQGAQLRIVVQLDGRLFEFDTITQGRLVGAVIDPITSALSIEVEFASIDVSSSDVVITEISGKGLLSAVSECPITIAQATWVRSQGSPVSRADTGRLTVGSSCNRGDRPVRFLDDAVVSVRPVPADDAVQISGIPIQSTPIVWSIVSTTGETIIRGSSESQCEEVSIDIRGCAPGQYLLMLTSHGSSIHRPLIIQR
ncbi:MAG: hypothetical protein ACKOE4_07880 [Candidatus Kapaibacterium sp.]